MPNILNLKKQIRTKEKQEKEQGVADESLRQEEIKNTPASPAEAGFSEHSDIFHPLEWSALEFIKYKKNPFWFIIGGLIALGLLIFALISRNFIFALLIILAAFSLYIWSQKEPRKIKFAITARGIMIEKNLYNFDNLKSFWLFYDPPEIKYLSLESKKLFMPYIKIPLGDEDPNKIRELLLKFLPEVKQEESLIDALARHLKF